VHVYWGTERKTEEKSTVSAVIMGASQGGSPEPTLGCFLRATKSAHDVTACKTMNVSTVQIETATTHAIPVCHQERFGS